MQEPLAFLSRDDKWYLGTGDAVIWAPSSPLFLDQLGFWDPGFYLDYPIGPLFTVTLLNRMGQVVHYRRTSRQWSPSRIYQTYEHPLLVSESKAVCGNSFVSDIQISRDSEETGSIVLWTSIVLDENTSLKRIEVVDGGVLWELAYKNAGRYEAAEPFSIPFLMKSDAVYDAYSIQVSEVPNDSWLCNQPNFDLSPFYEQMAAGRLNNRVNADGLTLPFHKKKLLYIALQYPLERIKETGRVVCILEVGSKCPRKVSINSVSADWSSFFAKVPSFRCSDRWLEKYYWYRWYGIKLNTISHREGNYRHPCVAEGPNPVNFRHHITYSAWCHILETRWMHDAALAEGSILNFIEAQRDDGSFVGGLGTHVKRHYQFNANWGYALKALQSIHPSKDFVSRVYPSLSAHARFFMEQRDSDNTSLYEVTNQIETGQEYSPRYLAARCDADHWVDFRLKGIDVTVYVYELFKFLGEAALLLERCEESQFWRSKAAETKDAVRQHMWDEKDGMFYDLLPGTLEPVKVKTAVCFYPFMTDLADEEHVRAIRDHLLNPAEFWTPYPVPTLSQDHPMFDPEARWKGQRHNCPWNGRVWPMTNSHLVEALARVGEYEAAAELLHKFIRMMFFDGDPNRPNCFEHYNPLTGKECLYRQVDDYQHSWVVDLIIKYVAGLQVKGSTLVFNPLPMGLSYFSLTGARIQERSIDVFWDEQTGLVIGVDGYIAERRNKLERLEIDL